MKKLFLLTALLILGTFATWAQTNELSFTIYPEELFGEFTIWYSTKNAPSTNVVEVDWGNNNLVVYNDKAPTGSDPTKKIVGILDWGFPIKIYSNCIEAIYIQSKARALRCDANNPHLEYIYYFQDNINPENLEALYMSLISRNGDSWGELHLSESTSIANASDNILKSNAFLPIYKNWRVCSIKAWYGSPSERIRWNIDEYLAKVNLIPAITLRTPTLADITDLMIGIRENYDLPWFVDNCFIRIDDGTNNYNYLDVARYWSNDDFLNNAPKITLKGTGETGLIKIYGAIVSHFKSNEIRSLDLSNTTNLRYLYINNCNTLTSVPGLRSQKELLYLNLAFNANLTSVNVEQSEKLQTLNVTGCTNLGTLFFDKTSLEFLRFSRCINLPPNRISKLLDARELSSLHAENLGWDACAMDDLFGDLPYRFGEIYIDDAEYTEPSNDWEGSNKTIANQRSWFVYHWYGTYIELTGDGGGCITGISQEEAAKFITVFPNPATDVVNITLVPNLNAESLQVIDVTGKTIFSMPVSPNELEVQINVSDYAKGIYLIRIGNVTQKLLVK